MEKRHEEIYVENILKEITKRKHYKVLDEGFIKYIIKQILINKKLRKHISTRTSGTSSGSKKRKETERDIVKNVRALLKILSLEIDPALNIKNIEDVENILKKNLSTKERINFYETIYSKIFEITSKGLENKNEFTIIDLGCGLNPLSYIYLEKIGIKARYLAIDVNKKAIEIVKKFFEISGREGKAIIENIFNIENIVDLIRKEKKPRIVFLFKVIDALEIVERNFSKILLMEIKKYVDVIVISFPLKALGGKKPIYAKRTWIKKFLAEHFEILGEFSIPNELFIIVR